MDTFRSDPPRHERVTQPTAVAWRRLSQSAEAKHDVFWSFGHGEYVPPPEATSDDLPPTEADLAMDHLIARANDLIRRTCEITLGLACWPASVWAREQRKEGGR